MLPPAHYPCSMLLADGTRLELLQAVREVPGRRVVCRGAWQGREVYAKLFYGTRARRDAARDAGGVRALAGAGVPTPALLCAGTDAEGAAHVLVFEAISQACNAEDVWRSLAEDDPRRLQLAHRLVAAVAAHHRAGLVQHDMYPKNFLVQGARILTLDGDSVRAGARPAAMLRNLAVLLSKFPPLFDRHIPELWRTYARVAGRAEEAPPARLAALVVAERRAMISKYADRKVLRECTDVHVEAQGARWLAVARAYWQPPLLELLRDPEAFLAQGRCAWLKRGGSASVALVEIGENKLVVKRYNPKTTFRGVLRRLRPSRARASWSNAHRLVMYEIATPRPVALIEERRLGLLQRAYFIAEYLETDSALDFFRADHTAQERAGVARAIARTLHQLYRAGLEHGDMKGTNLKVCGSAVALIDLDAMRQHRRKRWIELRHLRDLRRLFRNWVPGARECQELTAAFAGEYGSDWGRFARAALPPAGAGGRP